MRPDPECLERLWVVAAKDPARSFVFPISYQLDGTFGAWPSWCGFLVAREIIEEVGLPMTELFWWAEDTEYLQWRIPQAGYPMRVVGDAFVRHDAIRHGDGVPVWKYYYEARNMLYVHLYVKKRVGYYPRNIAKLLGRAILREHGGAVGPPAGDGQGPGRRGPRTARHPVPDRVDAGAHLSPEGAGASEGVEARRVDGVECRIPVDCPPVGRHGIEPRLTARPVMFELERDVAFAGARPRPRADARCPTDHWSSDEVFVPITT